MAQVHGKIEEKDHEFLRKLYYFIGYYKGQLPNLRDIFRPEAIEWLLTASIKRRPIHSDFVHFVVNTGFKDEPDVGEDGKPLLRRTTPIHHASRIRNKNEAIPDLFKIYDRFDVNCTDEDGLTHFHVACALGREDVVEKFLEVGQDPNLLVTKTGESPLHLAARNGRKEVTLLLLRNGANPNLANEEGLTPLHIICKDPFNTEDIAKIFFEINNDKHLTLRIDARDNKGRTPLHLALECKKNDVVKYLLKRGADPNLADEEGFTPLHVTCKRTSLNDLTELFFKINDELTQLVKVDARDNEGRTPLQWVVSNLNPDVIDVLLDHGADLSSFVFPSSFESKCHTKLIEYNYALELKLSLVSGILAVVERLEKRGYELIRDDALKIVEFFIKHELFGKSTDLDDNWFDDEEFAEGAKKIVIKSSLSFYDLIQLQPEEVTKLFTPEDLYNLTKTEELWYLPEEVPAIEACARCLCEKISRGFFRRWALDPLLELTKYQLPILCCEMIIKDLMNEDLCHIYLAATDQGS